MKICYIGSRNPGATAFHRYQALLRLRIDAEIHDPAEAIAAMSARRLQSALHYRTGYRLLQGMMLNWLKELRLDLRAPDIIWVDSGDLLGPECVKFLKSTGAAVILYNCDDPTGARDGARWGSLRPALRHYDLCITIRRETLDDLPRWGVRNAMRVWRTYDEEQHRPFANIADIPEAYRSEVAFIGTWMRNEHRDQFLLSLAAEGVPISIWGNSWEKGRYWRDLKPFWRGSGIIGRDYVAAVQGAKICLGLLSKGNRDRHTGRSLEIPYIGGLLCAQRTEEHMALYEDGHEAVFWDDAAECARLCLELLADDPRRERIRQGGQHKVRALKVGNEDMCRTILDKIATLSSPALSIKDVARDA